MSKLSGLFNQVKGLAPNILAEPKKYKILARANAFKIQDMSTKRKTYALSFKLSGNDMKQLKAEGYSSYSDLYNKAIAEYKKEQEVIPLIFALPTPAVTTVPTPAVKEVTNNNTLLIASGLVGLGLIFWLVKKKK